MFSSRIWKVVIRWSFYLSQYKLYLERLPRGLLDENMKKFRKNINSKKSTKNWIEFTKYFDFLLYENVPYSFVSCTLIGYSFLLIKLAKKLRQDKDRLMHASHAIWIACEFEFYFFILVKHYCRNDDTKFNMKNKYVEKLVVKLNHFLIFLKRTADCF